VVENRYSANTTNMAEGGADGAPRTPCWSGFDGATRIAPCSRRSLIRLSHSEMREDLVVEGAEQVIGLGALKACAQGEAKNAADGNRHSVRSNPRRATQNLHDVRDSCAEPCRPRHFTQPF
jgi:hypothetical protein